ALEGAVLERMILDVHGEALVGGIEAGTLGHRPALEDAFELEPEVVVQPARRVLLDDEKTIALAAPGSGLARGLWSLLEVALALILAQSHEFIFPRVTPSVHRKPWDLPARLDAAAVDVQYLRMKLGGKT